MRNVYILCGPETHCRIAEAETFPLGVLSQLTHEHMPPPPSYPIKAKQHHIRRVSPQRFDASISYSSYKGLPASPPSSLEHRLNIRLGIKQRILPVSKIGSHPTGYFAYEFNFIRKAYVSGLHKRPGPGAGTATTVYLLATKYYKVFEAPTACKIGEQHIAEAITQFPSRNTFCMFQFLGKQPALVQGHWQPEKRGRGGEGFGWGHTDNRSVFT